MGYTQNKNLKKIEEKIDLVENLQNGIIGFTPEKKFWMVLSNSPLLEAIGLKELPDAERVMPQFNPRHPVWIAWDETTKAGLGRIRMDMLYLYAQRHPEFREKLDPVWDMFYPHDVAPWYGDEVLDPDLIEIYEYAVLMASHPRGTQSGYTYEWYHGVRREDYPTLKERHAYILANPNPVDRNNYTEAMKVMLRGKAEK